MAASVTLRKVSPRVMVSTMPISTASTLPVMPAPVMDWVRNWMSGRDASAMPTRFTLSSYTSKSI